MKEKRKEEKGEGGGKRKEKPATERKSWQLGWSLAIFPREFQFWGQKANYRE